MGAAAAEQGSLSAVGFRGGRAYWGHSVAKDRVGMVVVVAAGVAAPLSSLTRKGAGRGW